MSGLIAESVAHAQTTGSTTPEFIPDIKFPGLFEREPQDEQLLGKYIRAVFVYMVYTIGILSVVMLIFGGIKWVAAAGNPGQINDAKDVITNSIIGLIIGLTSVLLLNVINPAFTVINLNKLDDVTPRYFEGARVVSVCEPVNNPVSDSTEVLCGSLKQVGTVKDAEGKDQPTFCIGIYCPYGIGTQNNIISAVTEPREICHIQKTPNSNYYRPGRGCIDELPVAQPTPAKFSGLETLKVQNTPFNLTNFCGDIGVAKDVGGKCNKWRANGYCFAIGDAKIADNSIPIVPGFSIPLIDQVTNMCCAGDDSYSESPRRDCPMW